MGRRAATGSARHPRAGNRLRRWLCGCHAAHSQPRRLGNGHRPLRCPAHPRPRATRLTAETLRLETLDLVAAPRALGRNRFGVALAVNVNAFWTEPAEAFDAVAELLAPGGRLYLVYEPPTARQRRRLQATLPEIVTQHSFRVADVRTTSFVGSEGLCVVAEAR